MSELGSGLASRSRHSTGSVVWFVWMVGMWVAFFGLLFAGRLDDLWRLVTQLPLVVEIVAWIAFFPWLLGTWVWTGSWPEALRVALVLCFAVGWTLVSIPRRRRPAI